MSPHPDRLDLSGPDAVRFWRILHTEPRPTDLSEAIERYRTEPEHDPRLTPPGESVSVRALNQRGYAR